MTDTFETPQFSEEEAVYEPAEEAGYEFEGDEYDDAGYDYEPEEGYEVGSEGGLYDQIAGAVGEEREWVRSVDSLGEAYPEFQEDSAFVEEVREHLDNLGGDPQSGYMNLNPAFVELALEATRARRAAADPPEERTKRGILAAGLADEPSIFTGEANAADIEPSGRIVPGGTPYRSGGNG